MSHEEMVPQQEAAKNPEQIAAAFENWKDARLNEVFAARMQHRLDEKLEEHQRSQEEKSTMH